MLLRLLLLLLSGPENKFFRHWETDLIAADRVCVCVTQTEIDWERESGCVLQSKEDHSTDVIFAPRQGIGMANVFLRRRLSKRFFVVEEENKNFFA